MPASPSFILFITDQQRADDLGCYGHPVLKTPHIDSIAARGVAMDRFYVASPVCMPNRASLMTGRMPSSHGARAVGIPLARESVTFVDLLAAAGYRTALIGKSHLQNFSNQKPLFTKPDPKPGLLKPPARLSHAIDLGLTAPEYEEENPDLWARDKRIVNTPFYGFQHVDLVTGHSDQCSGNYLHWLHERHPDAEGLRNRANAGKHDYICPQAIRTALPEELYPTTFIRERAVKYLRNVPTADPFFLMVSFPDPHHPFTPPGKYWDMYKPDQMPKPAAFTRSDWKPSPFVQRLIEARASGQSKGKDQAPFAVSEREALEARALTCGMIAMIDDAVGEVLSTLAATGRTQDTVLMFMSDHGDYLGEHRLLFKGASLYQSIIRTPFLWADPTSTGLGKHSAAIASTVDVAPTVLERAGLAPYHGIEGISQLETLNGGAPARDAAFIQYDHQRESSRPGRMQRAHGVVTADWRISLAEGMPGGELYDLKNDPDEFFNRWADRTALDDKCAMLDRLARIQMESVDEIPLPTKMS